MYQYLLRNKDTHVVHDAVREGGGTMEIMMTVCGLHVRWDLPHKRWERAQVKNKWDRVNISCRKCKGR